MKRFLFVLSMKKNMAIVLTLGVFGVSSVSFCENVEQENKEDRRISELIAENYLHARRNEAKKQEGSSDKDFSDPKIIKQKIFGRSYESSISLHDISICIKKERHGDQKFVILKTF
jgi:hypothetical protein